jgi:hypothetical protein
VVGIAVLLFAATGFVGSLQDALDKIWDAPPRPDGVWSFIKNKLFSFSFVLLLARCKMRLIIWDAPPRPDGVWSFIKNKLFSFSFVLDSPKELSRRPSRSRTSHYRC